MTVRVLYLHHYPVLGGASRSLWEMIESLSTEEVIPHVVTPRGQFAGLLRERGVKVLESVGVSLFDNTRYGHYRGLRWLILLRELAMVPATIMSLLKARRMWPNIDLVHVNEATMLLSVVLARWLFKRPVVLHVRSVMSATPGWRGWLFEWVLWQVASQVVAIDETVRQSLPAGRPVQVIHNGLRVPEVSQLDEPRSQERVFTVAMVGNLLRVKGCLDFVDAAAVCKQRGLAIRFLLIGQSARAVRGMVFRLARIFTVSQEVEPELRERIAAQGLGAMVQLTGFSADLSSIYRSMDVVCFPSHFDAPGRPIFEAAVFGVPSIAAISRPLPDTIIDKVTGLTVPPRDPPRLADAIQQLFENPSLRLELGRNARSFAVSRFDARVNAAKMLAAYRRLMLPGGARAG